MSEVFPKRLKTRVSVREVAPSVTGSSISDTVTLNFSEKTWLELKDREGRVLVSKTFKPGDVYTIENMTTGMQFETGNAGGFKIKHDGKTYRVGQTGQVLRAQTFNFAHYSWVEE